jgi:uncharacterized protein
MRHILPNPGFLGPGLALSLVLALAGCAGNQAPMRYYLLTPEAMAPAATDALAGRVTIIGPLQLPGYLNRPQLMVRLPGDELALRERHRWAEPLEAVMARTLAENLARITGSERILTFPVAGRIQSDQRVTARVIRFDADAAGLAVLEVQWSVVDGAGQVLVPVRSAAYREQAAGSDDAALVAALGMTLAQFSRELAADLVALAAGG